VQVYGYCDDQIWAPQWFDGADLEVSATPIDLEEGELRHLTFHLVEGGRIEGQVLEANGDPPFRADVELYDTVGDALCSHWSPGPEGIFEFSGLADGDYFLAVDVYPDGLWWYPGTADFTSATSITISDYATVTDIMWSLPQKGGRKP
jgi:hypothetical protein